MSILNLIRPDLLNIQNYVPGGDDAQHRLHANELPWSPIDHDNRSLNFYPDLQTQLKVQKLLAARYQVNADQVALTRGSDDGIDLITRLFLTARQDAFMQFPPTFPMYAFYVGLQQAELIQCPLDANNDFSLSLESINSSWKPNCKVIMICSPNNPTGNLIDINLIGAVCARYANKSVVVVDEAYIEFAQGESAISLVSQYENLVVLRTLSKANGMAGIRLGCIIAQAHVISAFNKIIAPFVLSTPVIQLAERALQQEEWLASSILRIRSERDELLNQLKRFSFIEKTYPTEANFILFKTSYNKELTIWLANQGIAIRDFPPNSLLHQHLRITVGDEQQNQLLINGISTFVAT